MAERFTDFRIEYNMKDLTTQGDISVDDYNASWVNTDYLINNTPERDYLTLEHNFSVLDGSLVACPDVSDSFGLLYDPPYDPNAARYDEGDEPFVVLVSTEYHSTAGLTIYFKADYPEDMNIEYFKDDVSIGSFDYKVDSNIFTAQDSVSLWNKIVITISTIRIPDRYVKIQGIFFGIKLYWSDDKLKQGTLVQEINRISDIISINTLSFELIDLENELNFGNPNGLHKNFQRRQELLPFETIETVDDDGNVVTNEIALGKFYLDTYSNELNLGKFSAVSFMGLMDGIPFNDGDIYDGVRAKIVIDKIFEVCEFTDYEIDNETANQLLYGTISPCTAREALKQVLFACNSILDSTDSSHGIKICKSSTAQLHSITRNTKINTKVTKNAYVSGVEIDYPEYTFKAGERTEVHRDNYEPGTYTVALSSPCEPSSIVVKDFQGNNLSYVATINYVSFTAIINSQVTITGKPIETTELHKDTYQPGTYTVIFSSPCLASTVQVTGATLNPSKTNTYYATFTVQTAGEVTITGYSYELKTHKTSSNRPFIDPGEIENIKKFSTSLCNASTAAELSRKLLNYYISQTLTLEIKHIADDIDMNDLRNVQNESPDYNNYLGMFTNRTFDLTGGFIDDAKLSAYFSLEDQQYYASDTEGYDPELYGGRFDETETPSAGDTTIYNPIV